jgi:phosphate uptake regulator
MVMSFFRKGESGMDHITAQVVTMIGDARHSFDLACATVLGGADPARAAVDIAETDLRINRTEADLRRELIVHVSVQGAGDIGQVLGHTLLIKKVERIGDQAKNILDLATEGVSLVGADDVGEFLRMQREISQLFADVAAVLLDPGDAALDGLRRRAELLHDEQALRIRELLHSERPGYFAVPRAILHRYLKRIVANLNNIATTVADPARLVNTGDDPPEN